VKLFPASFLMDVRQDPAPEPEKPTRGFIDALGHNLLDDMKHLPRRNSVYWLVGGGVAALAVHPLDDDVNRRLLGSDISNAFFPGLVNQDMLQKRKKPFSTAVG